MFQCPGCSRLIHHNNINVHLDGKCPSRNGLGSLPPMSHSGTSSRKAAASPKNSLPISSFFQRPAERRSAAIAAIQEDATAEAAARANRLSAPVQQKRSMDGITAETSPELADVSEHMAMDAPTTAVLRTEEAPSEEHRAKKTKLTALQKAAPLAERMRPRTLEDIYGQELVGPDGVLRGLIEKDRMPSMILWGGAGTGKTTIARCIAAMVGSKFVEINSTSSGVSDCKKIFHDAKAEMALSGRKTIIFCDEIHRFSKSQQDVFLGPVESGQITLIGATTENPSFKVQTALLSRCRTFTLQKLTDEDVRQILERALAAEQTRLEEESAIESIGSHLVDTELVNYLAAFSDGDARTALNLLELAMSLSTRPGMTKSEIKSSLTKTLVYDRAGDQHYDTISAFHKSVRGSDPDAALYYLARMLQSGEDPLYIARRMIVIASEDVGLADNSLITLATSAYSAAEKIGMPECRINLAHAAVALSLAPKSTRTYRALGNAYAALREPGVAGLPIPVHLRNAPTKLMKELGYGAEYKYNPNYKDGKVVQEYLPDELKGRKFLEDRDLGTEIDPEAWN